MNLFFILLIIGAIVGVIASYKKPRQMLYYIPISIVGAIFGAFFTFGDAPFLLRHSYLNPQTSAIAGSIIFVAVTWGLKKLFTSKIIKK